MKWMLICAIAPISWGATYYVTRHYLPPDAPLWGAAFRALPAGLVLILFARKLPRGDWWWKAALLGLLNFATFFVLVYLAAQLLPTSVAASIMALAPIVLAALAVPLLGQLLRLPIVIGAVIGVGGVALLVGFGGERIEPLGVVVSLAALLLSSLGAIFATRWRDDLPLVATTSWQLIAGGLLLFAAAALVEGPPPEVTLASGAAYAAVAIIATALAFLCWFAGLRHLPAGTVGLVGLLNPVTGVLLGVMLAGERLGAAQWFGIALVGSALLIGRWSPRSHSTETIAAATDEAAQPLPEKCQCSPHVHARSHGCVCATDTTQRRAQE